MLTETNKHLGADGNLMRGKKTTEKAPDFPVCLFVYCFYRLID